MESQKPIIRLIAPIQRTYTSARTTTSVAWSILRLVFGVVTFFVRIFSILLAALAGNYAGDKLRMQLTGEPGHQLEFVHHDEHGNTFIAANLLLSNFLPALLLALIVRPRIVFAFLGGMVSSFFLGDRFENELWETLDEFLSGGDPTRAWPEPIRVIEKLPEKK